jgi:hypothetical protein
LYRCVLAGISHNKLPVPLLCRLQFTDGDFEDSTLTAIGRLGWKVESMTDGAIVPGTDTLTVTGGSGDLVGDC